MNKTEIIDAIAQDAELTKTQAARALNAALAQITNTLQQGGQVVLAGFGTFSSSDRPARTGRNPNTGQPINISASRVAKFKAGKALKDTVNGVSVEA